MQLSDFGFIKSWALLPQKLLHYYVTKIYTKGQICLAKKVGQNLKFCRSILQQKIWFYDQCLYLFLYLWKAQQYVTFISCKIIEFLTAEMNTFCGGRKKGEMSYFSWLSVIVIVTEDMSFPAAFVNLKKEVCLSCDLWLLANFSGMQN